MAIIGFNFDYLTPTKREVVHFLDELEFMSSRVMIELDQEKDSKIDEYLCKYQTVVIPLF